MKNFKEYLAESKKAYSFKIKVAGNLPEKFEENLKKSLEKYEVANLTKVTTPVQESPMDFPQIKNKEINIFDLVTEYPITSPEIINFVKELGVMEECMRVRGSAEPSEYETMLTDDQTETKIEHKDYFGNDFNKSFLKDLEKTLKEKKKSGDGITEYQLPKTKEDKAGLLSPVGSK